MQLYNQPPISVSVYITIDMFHVVIKIRKTDRVFSRCDSKNYNKINNLDHETSTANSN